MARFLYVKNGFITNIVEYGAQTPPLKTDVGEDIVPDLTSAWSVGQAYDVTADLQQRHLDSVDLVVFQELFRLTNLVRALNAQAPLTAVQYKNFLKSLM
jgi:hypothetical protein